MTNCELNQYILHYIEKDKTGRAVMLTGDWGMGKSYYVKNTLIPFLLQPENGEHKLAVFYADKIEAYAYDLSGKKEKL